MPRIQLSDVGLRSLKPPESGTVDYWDLTLPSFACRVSRGGAKTFILKINNSRRAIGRWPLISLADARREAKRLLAEKTLGKIRPQSITVPQAVELFLIEKGKARRSRTVADLKDRLDRHFDIKGQLADVTHQEIVRRLAKIKTPQEHNAALRVGKGFFTWASNRRYINDNPFRGISTHSTQSRARVLSDEELGRIWRACEHVTVLPRVGAALGTTPVAPCHLPASFATIVKLLTLTGQRRGEIAALQSSWVQSDTITLPEKVTKNGRMHQFPIGSLIATILQTAISTSQSDQLLFPAKGASAIGARPFNGWSKSKAALDELSGISGWVLHDLRRSYASRMASLGVRLEVVEKLLNHVSGSFSGVAGIYQRYDFMTEMRAAVERYEPTFEN